MRKKARLKRINLGITMGDPSGIGPALILKTLAHTSADFDITVIGDEWVFNRIPKPEIRIKKYTFVDLHNVKRANFSFSRLKAEYGRCSLEYLDKAVDLIKKGAIDCLVTAPICKEAVALSGSRGFRGHTEYLAAKFKTSKYCMMLLNKDIKFALLTTHIPLGKVSAGITRRKLAVTLELTYKSLREYFLIPKPRIVVCALNPHGSDNGLIGDEENRIFKPVVNRLRTRTAMDVRILPADTAISLAAGAKFDCVIAAYHDQALIPLKLLGDDSGVNLTLGLPFVRTSPLHGTAFDIAKRPQLVNPASFIHALRLAVSLCRNKFGH